MKTVKITGKHNVDKLEHTEIKNAMRGTVNYEEPDHKQQVTIVNKYFMGEDDGMKESLVREIRSKIRGYKNQDTKKHIFDETLLVDVSSVTEKLVASKLLCHYCKHPVKVLFSGVRDERQWTLDRIDNDACHSDENTVICCLKCNLERRVTDAKKFTFTKQLRITKTG